MSEKIYSIQLLQISGDYVVRLQDKTPLETGFVGFIITGISCPSLVVGNVRIYVGMEIAFLKTP